MARETFENNGWIPEESSSNVITRINDASAVEGFGNHEPMGTDVKLVPRMGAVGVAFIPKGTAYPESTGANDSVILTARKLGEAVRIAEEDINDSPLAIIEKKKLAWAGDYARYFDHAALGVSAAENGTTIPFTSVYKAVTTADAAVGYTANANHTSSPTGAMTYASFASALDKVEASTYFDESRMVVIAHPSFKGLMRGIVNTVGDPTFIDVRAGQSVAPTFFGYEVKWSLGAKVAALPTATPGGAGGAKGAAGNPLMIIVNRDLLLVGDRSNPESVVIDGRDGLSALTDETLIKLRSRKGFALGDVNGAYVYERVTA